MMVLVDEDDKQWCEEALFYAYVAAVPGSTFGATSYLRFAYTRDTEQLGSAID